MLLTKYLSVERERSRKYSVSWQQKHSASELQKISRAIVYLQAKGVATLDDLDAALSAVDGRAKALNESVKTKEGRMKKLQKLIEQGGHYNRFKPVHDELKAARSEVRELQQIRRCIDAAERCNQQGQKTPQQKKQNMEL